MSQPRGLGKGLNAILGEVREPVDDSRRPVAYVHKTPLKQNAAGVQKLPIEKIQPNPFQPRQSFDPEALQELSNSIRTLGLIQPITVRRVEDGNYQIVSGERRYKACRLAGMTEVPAYIIVTGDQGMMEMAIVENIQRENLDPIEVALSYQRLMNEYGFTQETVAERLSKKRASVANQLRLLNLPVKVQHDLKLGLISVGHAKVILGVPDPDTQIMLCDLVISEDLNVRELEQKVKSIQSAQAPKPARKSAAPVPQMHRDLADEIGRYFGGRVAVKRDESGKGSLTVRFNSDEEVQQFLNVLKG